MNMKLVLAQESMTRQLIDMIQILSGTRKTAEEILAVMQAEYRSHMFVIGEFSLHKNIWGIEEIHFVGRVCSEKITLTVGCS
jgi:hypothetical protein